MPTTDAPVCVGQLRALCMGCGMVELPASAPITARSDGAVFPSGWCRNGAGCSAGWELISQPNSEQGCVRGARHHD